jgi:pyruvate, water dikinase
VYELVPDSGFESFATQVYNIITKEGRYAFYVFDCLTDLLEHWCSDLMLGNFFKITCPYLFVLDTVAYFAIIRNRHSFASIARIRETTQLLLDLRTIPPHRYLHPLKVWERYSPTMFLPHRIADGEFESITSSVDAAGLFNPRTAQPLSGGHIDYWDKLFLSAEDLLSLPVGSPERVAMFRRLVHILIGRDPKIVDLAHRFLTLEDIIRIKNRQIGTGYIGGKSVGMILARNILTQDPDGDFSPHFEPHDSFYLGSDIFYTYLVQNGWWHLRMEQISPEGYFAKAPELKEKLLSGTFPVAIRERFLEMLEYFGQSPIIVRSSSLLEDNFGNAFAGKYESVFCVNQGTPEDRYEQFENAVRTVYASTMSEDALNYRLKRNLSGKDEQMALLVQRVSGDYRGRYFFPALAGVGNSSNLYVWDKQIDPRAGMLRLVFGLGTHAVDRALRDYPRIVSLDKPLLWPVNAEDMQRFSQHDADVLDLKQNVLRTVPVSDLIAETPVREAELFAEMDFSVMERRSEQGLTGPVPYILTFRRLLSATRFPDYMRNVLACLERNYDYPVDIEYTVNFTEDGRFHVNLLQCRPLQTKGLGQEVSIPPDLRPEETLFSVRGDFMGGNLRLAVDRVIYVDPDRYAKLPERGKYEIARIIGRLNQAIDREHTSVMLIAPGRIGTTSPSMGVPVTFSEIANLSVICELEFATANLMPELSYGSHFFQDLVESDIFYVGLYPEKEGNFFHERWLLERENLLAEHLPEQTMLSDESRATIKVIACRSERCHVLQLFSDVVTQQCVCTSSV